MNGITPINRFEDLFRLALSIMLAAAIAHALEILSTTIPEEDWWIWLFSSILIIFIAITIICYILNISRIVDETVDEKDPKIRKENWRFWLNILIIGIITIDIFSFTRYLYFLTNPDITIKVSGISMIITIALTIILGLILIIQSFYDKKYKSNLRLTGVILIIFSAIIYIVLFIMERLN